MKNKRKMIGIAAMALVLVLVLGCGVYANDYYRADDAALQALSGNETVTVIQEKDMVVFSPEEAAVGFIFYPGGKVEYTAYAPLLLAMAEQNVLCILVEMPLNLAVLDMDAAAGIPEGFPEVDRWYIGGHSLGGSMAASYVAEHSEAYDGLALLGSYSTADLTATSLNVISLYGSQDKVLNMEKYLSYRSNLPENTVENVIVGGNHAGFGSYGAQEGDGEATITREEQTAMAVALLHNFFAD